MKLLGEPEHNTVPNPAATPHFLFAEEQELPSRAAQRVKRILDVVGALLLLLVLSPLMVLLAIWVRLDSPGPSLFVQPRIGRFGREFRMWKFRSMCVDAEDRLASLAHLNQGGAHLIRISHDPRVTRLGAFLRRSCLDELPQLVNVLRGDMSLVGPRPQLANEVALYTPEQHARLNAMPGMTGLWQVTARGDPSFEQLIKLDFEYIRNWSLGLDLRILLRTPLAILKTINSHGRTVADHGPERPAVPAMGQAVPRRHSERELQPRPEDPLADTTDRPEDDESPHPGVHLAQ